MSRLNRRYKNMKLNLYLEASSGRVKNIFFATGTRVYREIVGKTNLVELRPKDIKHLLTACSKIKGAAKMRGINGHNSNSEEIEKVQRQSC
jgi:hypothetical protein